MAKYSGPAEMLTYASTAEGNSRLKQVGRMKDMETLKPNARRFVSVNPSKCTGCGLCEYVCALEKGEVPNPLRSRIRVIRLNPLLNVAMTCRFCEDAPCVKACPREALKQSEGGGVLIISEEKCDACGWCFQACPYGGIVLHPDKRIVVACDLCSGEPKCIEFCPEEALELVTDDATSQKTWISTIEKLPSETERLANLIKRRALTEIFTEAEERAKRLEEKLEAINKREVELRTGSQKNTHAKMSSRH